MKSVIMTAKTVVQITMALVTAIVIPKMLSKCVTMMVGTVANLRKLRMEFVMLET